MNHKIDLPVLNRTKHRINGVSHIFNLCVISDKYQVYMYSREQKHVLISDTPMLLIKINSISNMGCQK